MTWFTVNPASLPNIKLVLLVSYDLPAESRTNFPGSERMVKAFKTEVNTLRNGFRNKLINKFGAQLAEQSLLMIRDTSDETIQGVRDVIAKFTQRYNQIGLTPSIKVWTAVV